MTETTLLALSKVFAALWDSLADSGGMEASEIEDLLEHSGLAVWTVATEGEPILMLTPEGKTLYLMGTTE